MRYRFAGGAAALLLLLGCEARPGLVEAPGDAAGSVLVSGSLSYRERMALPAGATALVTLTELAPGTDAPAVAHASIPLDGRNVPIGFELEIEAGDVLPERRYRLEARIEDAEGRPLWATAAPHRVELDAPRVEIGELILVRTDAAAAEADGAAPAFTARGNEPGWLLTIDDRDMSLEWNYGRDALSVPRPEPVVAAGERRWLSSEGGHELVVDVVDGVCQDTMTGMPYPARVEVTIDGSALEGCGGSPAALLEGGEWVVEDLGGKGVIDRSRLTLSFETDGQLGGRGGCNAFGATYRLSGEGLTIGNARATLMACGPALDAQEREFFRLLESTTRFDIAPDGALILHSADGGTILARRDRHARM